MVTRSEVKVGGQGQGIGHGVKSGGGVKVGGPGRGSRSGEGSRFGGQGQGQSCGQGQGSMSWVKVRVMIGGHKVWGYGWGSILEVKVSGVVKVMGRGSMPGGLGSDGRWGEVGDKQSVPFKNS